ncbi:hypothetical protein [Listeria ilorinensis]|uniref:hypothetical protein n=1 Tax=Listeria ilorinensis TaxID=2867439 RepID=UPI001EF5315B|nr:hypothetical protein [Listeria ilorinensis]
MIGPIVDWVMNINLGALGRGIVAFIEANSWLFLALAMLYGALLVYAKLIVTDYLPKKMKAFLLARNSSKKDAPEVLYQEWLQCRKALPAYILVPSKNELWVKPARSATGREKALFFRSEKQKKTEQEQFLEVAKEVNN